jgi:hypothetical protein
MMNASAILCAKRYHYPPCDGPDHLLFFHGHRNGPFRAAPPSATASVNPDQICDGVLTLINLTGTADPAYSHYWSSNPLRASPTRPPWLLRHRPAALRYSISPSRIHWAVIRRQTDHPAGIPISCHQRRLPFLCTSDPVLVSTVSISGAGAGSTYVWDSIPPCVTPQTPSGASQAFDFSTCGTGHLPLRRHGHRWSYGMC